MGAALQETGSGESSSAVPEGARWFLQPLLTALQGQGSVWSQPEPTQHKGQVKFHSLAHPTPLWQHQQPADSMESAHQLCSGAGSL